MGYSCTQSARIVWDKIMEQTLFQIDHIDYKYFAEIGRENTDGAMTGEVWLITGSRFVDSDGNTRVPARKMGHFRIAKNGKIERFPGLPKCSWGIFERTV